MSREARCLFVWTILSLLVGCQRDSAPAASRVPAPANGAWPDADDVVAQLEGRHCRYSVQLLTECQPRPPRGLFEYLFTRHDDRWTCPTGAARCLAKMGPAAAAAVPALVRALEQGPPDYDTGDGVIPVRSSVIEALGKSGDARAVEPLGRAVSEPPYAVAALWALRDLGPLAQGQAGAVASALEARVADTEGRARACAEAVRQYDYFLANDAVVERLKAAHPEQTRFLVTPAEHAAALRALDRSTDTYVRGREGRCRDLVGDAAVEALAAMGCETCAAHIVGALREPSVAQQAAWELTRMTSLPEGAKGALQAVLASERHGPSAKDAARQALEAQARKARLK
jgi:HEAT repeat protein